QRVRALLAEGRDEVCDAVPEQVVAEIHDERRVAEELLGGEDGMREPERRVLLDVRDRDTEAFALAGHVADLPARLRRDDDPDLADAGRGQRLDPVEEDGLVRHRHELLGARVGDRAEAAAGAPGEDQAFQLLHGRNAMQFRPAPGLTSFSPPCKRSGYWSE